MKISKKRDECMNVYFWFIGVQVLKQYYTLLNMYEGSEWRNKFKINRRHDNPEPTPRTECDETTKRIRLEGKIFYLLFLIYIK